MPEQFTLNQVFRNSSAIDVNEHLVLTRTLSVNSASNQFLPGSGLAENQDPTVGWRHQLNLLAQRLHGNAIAHDHCLWRQLLFEVAVLLPQFLRLDGILDKNQGFFQ